jgi:hypothetical protein
MVGSARTEQQNMSAPLSNFSATLWLAPHLATEQMMIIALAD